MYYKKIKLSDNGKQFYYNGKPVFKVFEEALKFHAPGLAAVKDETGWYHINCNGQAIYKKRYKQTFGYYDTHMNQNGNEIFASSWLSSYHGKGYNHTHIYQPYPISGITSLNSQAHVCGSKVSIYSQLQVASGTTFSAGNNKIITYSNNVVGLPLYSLSARAITCWVNLTTSNGSMFKCIPAYLSVKDDNELRATLL